MDYPELIDHYKTETAAARAIGIDRQRVNSYKATGKLPLDKQCEWELDSEGALKADLPACIRDGDYKAEKRRRLEDELART